MVLMFLLYSHVSRCRKRSVVNAYGQQMSKRVSLPPPAFPLHAHLSDNTYALPNTLLITGCAELLTLRCPLPRRRRAVRELRIIRDGALFIKDGRVEIRKTQARETPAACPPLRK